jgi:hypothetical protein
MTSATPYLHPITQIIRLRDSTHWSDTWLDYAGRYGLTIADIPELTRLCWDDDPHNLVAEDEDQDEEHILGNWMNHGLRAVTQLDPRAGIALFLKLLGEFPEDDFLREEAEGMGRHTGAESIEPLTEFLRDVCQDVWSRNAAITTLEEMGRSQPELRDQLVQLLMEMLQNSATMGGEADRRILTANLIASLIKLQATEAADLLAEMFATQDVDEWVTGSWPAAQVELGLKQASDFLPGELDPTPPDYILAIRAAQAAREEKTQMVQMAAELLDISRSLGPSRSISPANPSMMPTSRKPASSGFGAAQTEKKAKKKKR